MASGSDCSQGPTLIFSFLSVFLKCCRVHTNVFDEKLDLRQPVSHFIMKSVSSVAVSWKILSKILILLQNVTNVTIL